MSLRQTKENLLNKDTLAEAAIWVLLTAVGEYAFRSLDIFGDAASEQGVFIDYAFILNKL